MLDSILHSFHMPEHHGGRGMKPQPVCNIHHLQPIIAHRLKRRDALTHRVNKDFSTASRNGPQPRSSKIANNFLQRFAEHFAKVNKLARTESVNIDLWEPRVNM